MYADCIQKFKNFGYKFPHDINFSLVIQISKVNLSKLKDRDEFEKHCEQIMKMELHEEPNVRIKYILTVTLDYYVAKICSILL